jgi:hypothetical protein
MLVPVLLVVAPTLLAFAWGLSVYAPATTSSWIVVDGIAPGRDTAPDGPEVARFEAQREWDCACEPRRASILVIRPLWAKSRATYQSPARHHEADQFAGHVRMLHLGSGCHDSHLAGRRRVPAHEDVAPTRSGLTWEGALG